MQLIALNDLGRHNSGLRDELAAAASAVLDSGWYVLGAKVNMFEAAFARYCGTDHCVGTANGTDALELALRGLGVGLGARVVTVANAGMYSTIAIRTVGAEPLFVDIDPASLCVDVESFADALELGPSAAIVTHLYGQMADIDAIVALCAEYGVPLIEDCAQAHGAILREQRAGSFGAIGCFSFYPTKNLGALGDGGALVTSDADLVERLRRLRQYGWGSKYIAMIEGGRNSRLDELQAAFLQVKLPHLDSWNAQRREIARRYSKAISHPEMTLPLAPGPGAVAHLYVIRAKKRESLRSHLANAGIATDVHYPIPDHRQPCFTGRYDTVSLLHTEVACGEVLTLPCFPEMTDDETQRVIDACNTWCP